MPASAASLVKPTHKAIQAYYAALKTYGSQHISHETALRSAFQNVLFETGRLNGWTLIPELSLKVGGKTVRPDGTLRDEYYLPRGYWEAKDTADHLDDEIRKKTAKGYPLTNTIFEDTQQAALFQGGNEVFRADLTSPQQLADLLNQFYRYAEPDIESFEQAVAEFQERVPELATGLADKIKQAHKDNSRFQAAYTAFFELCKTALNPNISRAAVDEMLVQHLLTERLIRKIFDNPEFTRRNVIAAEVEKVIDALVSRSFNRDEFLRSLDRFYRAIEDAAHSLEDFTDKQHFLNSIYERFFQGYSVKIADTHGIVYTPQPIVDFMCASVVEVLQTEFGKSLADPDVMILDPATGTGNFIVNLLHRVPKRDLADVYRNHLFANEVMLLPYYIAALNIEHAYYELADTYEPFEGLCFVDTLDIAEGSQLKLAFMTEQNTERVERQKKARITVIVGNPPYNMGQQNENDNNKNRSYEIIDKRINETYARDSKATLNTKLYDAYVKFFRWAVDRLQDRDGIVCLVTNNSFVDQIAFDGMRKHMLQDFTRIFHVDLHGNVRQNPKLSGTTHNVFGIQVGVGVTVAVRSSRHADHRLHYYRVPEDWRKEEKLNWMTQRRTVSNIDWQSLIPDRHHTWLIPEHADEFGQFLPIGSKAIKNTASPTAEAVFKTYSLGIATNRDRHVYSFDPQRLRERAETFVEIYNKAVDTRKRRGAALPVDALIDTTDPRIKWTRQVKASLEKSEHSEFQESHLRNCLYRPFTSMWVYFDDFWNEEHYQQRHFFPRPEIEEENLAIALTDLGSEKPFMTLMINTITDLHLVGAGCGTQCFPFYSYDEDGSNRRENLTDWALAQFRVYYGDESINKWDIFYFVYGLLHHPGYREKFADNLKRELPRIPFAPDFHIFAKAGRRLADLHLNYETVTPYNLQWIEADDASLSHRVEKMRLNKDKTILKINDSLTLNGIPSETFEYRLGNRSALEWIIDQYQITTDTRSGITSDPNREDAPRNIVDLVGRVITVSVETVKIVAALPREYSPSK